MSRPAGRVLRQETIPARGYLALEVPAGARLRLVDQEGKQCADVVLWRRDDLEERLSTAYTRTLNGTWRITRGHTLYSWRCRPLAVISEDTVGQHHCSGAFCSGQLNEARYGSAGEASCYDNLAAAVQPWGLTRRDLPFDCCCSFFMRVALQPDGSMRVEEPLSRPGDFVELTMATHCLAAISACPQDRNACNGWKPTPLEIVVTAGA